MSRYWCEGAWLGPGRLEQQVLVTVDGSCFAAVESGVVEAPPDATRLDGLTMPGLANCHSHAFHRALRGRTQTGSGTFWSWREQMYAVAARLDPDSYYELARATYAEMVLAGITCVGEFHYLHFGRDGQRYDDPNAVGTVLVAAARDAGLRIALLDTCYLTGGIGEPASGVQRRFSDGDAERWAARVDDLRSAYAGSADVVVGAAVHSVRAVPADQIAPVASWAEQQQVPLHVHVSEQRAENAVCQDANGVTPVRLLHQCGALGPRTTAVHATHISDDDIDQLADSGAYVCLCPTTERDLGDGIGPAGKLTDAGVPLTVGSDSHAVIDVFEEMRAVELDERLASELRGHFRAEALLDAGTSVGHASLGFTNAGRIEPGAVADLVTVDTTSVRTSGTGGTPESLVYAATSADVRHVVAGGTVRVRDGRHVSIDVGEELSEAVERLW